MLRRDRPWTVRLAILLGISLGLWMLWQLRIQTPDVPPRRMASPPDPAGISAPSTAPKARGRAAPTLPPAAEPQEDDGGAVLDDTAAPLASSLTLHLEMPDGSPSTGHPRVRDCEVWDHERLDEATWRVTVRAGDLCTIDALRRDGLLLAQAQSVEVEAWGELDVYLAFDSHRQGGIGVQFEPSDLGVVVVDVVPGTPAWNAGLQPGDVIVEVGGQAIEDWTPEEFIAQMTGEAGTPVEFGLEFSSDTGLTFSRVTLTREWLSG